MVTLCDEDENGVFESTGFKHLGAEAGKTSMYNPRERMVMQCDEDENGVFESTGFKHLGAESGKTSAKVAEAVQILSSVAYDPENHWLAKFDPISLKLYDNAQRKC
ncbi:hypothetical protein SARC_00699 [Sphaeroforma arctica JP610]|uniref:Uncharacterized protein n=1 Tax=Sphaeroforma arctica JP610 TaxID=667725 RepID=A0A0L0GE68_9EUKA|nr:hypothetical protein SARC_00699 [Sphaeroforma arctica JP610]KNC87171.1 hypothetical protein SARC_00699 [Sphaeroforma arctica JP610]|eukprot:XP_014161073.1 hypothetical protein SARC_00699 [Sphaeroforma arctica JP610]